MRILVADDEAKIAQFIRKGLKEEGYAVDVASDGKVDFAKQGPVCTGPYMVKSFSKAKTELDANPNYYAAVPFKHTIVNTGTADLKMTWTMAPPGLETFFSRIGRPRQPGDATPAPFPRPATADTIQKETGFGDLQRHDP